MNLRRIIPLAALSVGLNLAVLHGCGAGGSDGDGGAAAAAATASIGDAGPDTAAAGSTGQPHLLGGAGGAGQLVVTTDSGVNVVVQADSGTYAEYHPSCEEQVCTAEEQCVDGAQGTYCVHPCPGQPCPQPAMESFCDRNGGVICI